MNKSFIYIPSFSAGVYGNQIKKPTPFKNGKPIRVYDKTIHESIYSKWFLAPAGHLYKNYEYRNQIGITDESILFGDSGGFQIASGALKWEKGLREKIFNWLESQCDYSVNLDVPPRMNFANKFEDSLAISKENFKYFAENQSGKTKFLNVMQGDVVDRYQTWCREVKHFDFNGWCLGGVGVRLSNLLSAIAVFIDEIDLFDKNIELVHSLGTSKIIEFAVLSQFQKSLNDIGSHIQVTTDSSSPNNASRFGNYYTVPDYKVGTFKSIHFPKLKLDSSIDMIPGIKALPKTATCDDWLEDCYDGDDVIEYTNAINCVMVLHGYGVFMDAKRFIDHSLTGHPYIMKQLFNQDILTTCNIVKMMVEAKMNNSSSVAVFNKFYNKILEIDYRTQQANTEASSHDYF